MYSAAFCAFQHCHTYHSARSAYRWSSLCAIVIIGSSASVICISQFDIFGLTFISFFASLSWPSGMA